MYTYNIYLYDKKEVYGSSKTGYETDFTGTIMKLNYYTDYTIMNWFIKYNRADVINELVVPGRVIKNLYEDCEKVLSNTLLWDYNMEKVINDYNNDDNKEALKIFPESLALNTHRPKAPNNNIIWDDYYNGINNTYRQLRSWGTFIDDKDYYYTIW